MKRRMLSLLLIAVMVLGMLPTIALAVPSQSNGVYQIGTAEDLLWFAQEVNSGNTGIKGKLTANIDLSSTSNWPGIGTSAKPFTGFFDGQGHTVTFKDAAVGLFGCIKGSASTLATVQNVITAGSVKQSAVAQEAGYAQFTNCINWATVTSPSGYAAGIVGKVIGNTEAGILKSKVQIINCGNEASISGSGSKVGGILGYSNSNTQLTGCYNKGNIYGAAEVGGLVGYLQGSYESCSVTNSYNTGTVTGAAEVGGIIGNMQNGVSVTNCYNAGRAAYAIAGKRYDQTAKVTNSYFLGTSSAKCSPDYNVSQKYNETTNEIQTRATARSASEMATAEFAALLGSAFQQSCPTPVLTWQTAVNHTGEICENCALGSTEKEIYDVSFQTHNGYTLNGEAKAIQGSSYFFTLTISEGYERATDFAVKVNGEVVTAASDGKYTVLNVNGPLSVTVLGVQVIPGSHAIQLPADGYGYRTEGNKTVKRDKNYSFTLTFVDGFKEGKNFKVIAQQILSQELLDKGYTPEEVELTGKNGTYTIPTVQKDYRILVSGVEAVSKGVKATVNFSITEGYNNFHEDPKNGNLVMDQNFNVPYFDLSLYGLERYYYNPYCYLDEAGNIRNIQQKGTPESAYDHITVMHAFIVATELYYFGYSPAQVGKGLSYEANPTAFNKAISWSQGAGSSFMDFWDHGTNLNYYVNYAYPLAYPGWGSTSDQIVLQDDDIISIHLITGQGSGSDFGFFTANDTNNKFNPGTDIVNEITVDQGEKVKLTYFWSSTSGNYNTGYKLQKNKQLYWIHVEEDGIPGSVTPVYDEDDLLVDGWWNTPLGDNILKTDANGEVTINTAKLEPGTYYISGLGGFTEGGGKDNAGFVSAGSEAGPSFFKLVVNEYEGKLGDVDGDTEITGNDVMMIQRYIAKLNSEINHAVADVDGDGEVTGNDVMLIQRYIAKLITSFPAQNP